LRLRREDAWSLPLIVLAVLCQLAEWEIPFSRAIDHWTLPKSSAAFKDIGIVDLRGASNDDYSRLAKTIASTQSVIVDHAQGRYPKQLLEALKPLAAQTVLTTPLHNEFFADAPKAYVSGMHRIPKASQHLFRNKPAAFILEPSAEKAGFRFVLRDFGRNGSVIPWRQGERHTVVPHAALTTGKGCKWRDTYLACAGIDWSESTRAFAAIPTMAAIENSTLSLASANDDDLEDFASSKKTLIVAATEFYEAPATRFGEATSMQQLAGALRATNSDRWRPVWQAPVILLIPLLAFLWWVGSRLSFALNISIAVGALVCAVLLALVSGLMNGPHFVWVGAWTYSSATLTIAYLTAQLRDRRDQGRIEQALKRALPHNWVRRLPKSIAYAGYAPRETFCTLMAIDLAGLGAHAENLSAPVAMGLLTKLQQRLHAIVGKYHGMIVTYAGDSVLAIFGHGILSRRDLHADDAVACGIEIQRTFLEYNLANSGEPQIAPRIAINTSSVFLALDPMLLELQALGHGVNFTCRLQNGCELYQLLVSPSTRSTMTSSDDPSWRRKLIDIKHQREAFAVYEANPFRDQPGKLQEALRQFQRSLGLERNEARVNLPTPFLVRSSAGDGRIVNVSKGGMAMTTSHYLARGTKLQLQFDDAPPSLKEILKGLNCEVRWSRPDADGYAHGLKYLDLNEDKKVLVLRELTPKRATA
jgi:class 3 adenylate cyclase